MHYIRLHDNNDCFLKLKEQLFGKGLAVDGNDEYIVCVCDNETKITLAAIISDYIWNIKFLDYVMKHTKSKGNCLRELDVIINTMNVANSFKECSDTVSERLLEFLTENKELNIDGFMNFRLRDFLNDFDNLLSFYEKSYEVESEYFDFICTLKECMDYSSTDEYAGAELHVVNCGGVSYILDAAGTDITEQCIREYTFEFADSEITRDDKIVSTLISMSPRVLHLHTNKYSGSPVLYDTLKAIFACRVIVE